MLQLDAGLRLRLGRAGPHIDFFLKIEFVVLGRHFSGVSKRDMEWDGKKRNVCGD